LTFFPFSLFLFLLLFFLLFANVCIRGSYARLPAKGKPNQHKEWTVMAAIVKSEGGEKGAADGRCTFSPLSNGLGIPFPFTVPNWL